MITTDDNTRRYFSHNLPHLPASFLAVVEYVMH